MIKVSCGNPQRAHLHTACYLSRRPLGARAARMIISRFWPSEEEKGGGQRRKKCVNLGQSAPVHNLIRLSQVRHPLGNPLELAIERSELH